jgi:4-amino-4-deoxy-L-arabinose transferase-like glycosyltransferase
METSPLPAPEPARTRRIFLAVALAAAAGFFAALHAYWVPADPNVDENAYLVSGKLLAETGSPGFVPPDPYALVGKMWIGTAEGRFYPKYPLGQPLLVAAAIRTLGLSAAFAVIPLLMALALLGVFLLVREAAGSPAGLLAMLALALSPVVLAETNDPDSHAASLAFTVWGMFLLLRWWRTGKLAPAAFAGLLLGYSAIVRYTDGLLLLPLLLVVLFRLGRKPDRRSLGAAAALLAGWAVPIAAQVAFNLRALHSLTGYDTTHESTAFSTGYFAHNWQLTARQLFTLGLPLILPLAVIGLALLTWRQRRLGIVLWAWLLPNLLLYTAYYWALENDGVNFLRFFLSVFPPLALGLGWLLTRPLPGPVWISRWAQPVVALALVLVCGVYGARAIAPLLASDRGDRQAARAVGEATLASAPAGSAIFGPQNALLALQYAGDYRLYSRTLFVRRAILELGQIDPKRPNALQPERAQALFRRLGGLSNPDLLRLQRNLMAAALASGRRVFLIAPAAANRAWLRFADPDLDASDGKSFAIRPAASWTAPGRESEGRGAGEEAGVEWALFEVTSDARTGEMLPGSVPEPRRGGSIKPGA